MRYRSFTYWSLLGEQVLPADLLPQNFVDEPGNGYQLEQLIETGTIRRLPDDPPAKG